MFTRRVIQAARPLMRIARPLPSPATGMRIQPSTQSRLSSTSPPSQHTAFYRTFGRPIIKALLVALLTYQTIYLGWVKLETDEMKAEHKAEIGELEGKVKELQGRKGS